MKVAMLYEDLSENDRFLTYDSPDGGQLVFIGRCPNCGRYVKADESVWTNEETGECKPNATCTKCGRVTMPYLGPI